MIKALFVDAGGVLFNNVTEEDLFFLQLSERYGVSPAVIQAAYVESEPVFEVGKSTASCALHSILTQLGKEVGGESIEELKQLYVSCVEPNWEVFSWLRRRPHPRQMRVFLANNEARDWDCVKHRAFHHLDLFDDVFPSWKVGYVKPSSEYFFSILESCNVNPHEALLVDDNQSCIQSALDIGLEAVLFEGVHSLPDLR